MMNTRKAIINSREDWEKEGICMPQRQMEQEREAERYMRRKERQRHIRMKKGEKM